MADLVIYGTPVSPFVRKVQAVIAEKGVDQDFEAVDIFNPPEWFVSISPAKRIPVMRDRSIGQEGPDGTIPDSSAICAYVERKHPQPPLLPADAFEAARALWIEEYADTSLAATGGLGIFRPILFPASQGKPPETDKARATWARKMPPLLNYLDEQLRAKQWFAGDAFGLADISVGVQLMQLQLVAAFDLSADYPALSAHLERCHARPSLSSSFAIARDYASQAVAERIALD